MSITDTAGARGALAGRRRLARPGAVAILAQVWQAAGSFALQVIAAHLLGAPGLALVSLCLGVIVLATAVSSGVVGDSLTVLDRRDPGSAVDSSPGSCSWPSSARRSVAWG